METNKTDNRWNFKLQVSPGYKRFFVNYPNTEAEYSWMEIQFLPPNEQQIFFRDFSWIGPCHNKKWLGCEAWPQICMSCV